MSFIINWLISQISFATKKKYFLTKLTKILLYDQKIYNELCVIEIECHTTTTISDIRISTIAGRAATAVPDEDLSMGDSTTLTVSTNASIWILLLCHLTSHVVHSPLPNTILLREIKVCKVIDKPYCQPTVSVPVYCIHFCVSIL